MSGGLTRIARQVAFGLLALLVLYLVYLGGGWAGIHSAELRQTSLVFVAVAAATWAAAAIADPTWRPRTFLWPAFVAALIVFAAATVTSRVPRVSAEYLAYAVVLTALYLLLVRLLASDWFRPRLGGLVVVLCAVTGLWYLFAVLVRWVEWWGLVGRIAPPPLRPLFESLTFGNPSAVLTMCVLLLAAAAGYVGATSRWRVALLAGLALLAAFATLVSGSRAGWLAVAIGAVATAVAWLAGQERRAYLRSLAHWAPRWWPALGVLAVAVLVLAAPGIASRVGAGGETLRTTYLAAATRMWFESPVLGTGPGSWVAQRIEYTQAGEPDFYIPHAHNVYAQTLAEFGIAGLVAGLVVLVSLAWLLRDGLRDPDPGRRRMAWAALFVVAYFAAHHLFDFYPSMPAALFAFAVPIAWLDATAQRSPAAMPLTPPRIRALGQVAIAGALIAGLAFLLRSEATAVQVNDAVIAANRGDWQRARAIAVPAVAGDPDIPAYQLTLGLALANTGEADAAAVAFRRAALADDLPESWLNLAVQEAERDHGAAAATALRQALRLGVQRPAIALAAGEVALRLGDGALAREAFTEAVRRAPTLAGDPWWSDDQARAALFPGIVDAAIAAEPPTIGIVMALEAGRFDQAAALAGGLAEPGRAVYEDLVVAWQGDDAALRRMVARCEEEPVGGPVSLAALVLGHLRHPDAARLRDWADVINAGTDPRAYELRVLTDPADFGKAFSVASFYGHYTYRRPTPWDLLVPSLPHVGLR